MSWIEDIGRRAIQFVKPEPPPPPPPPPEPKIKPVRDTKKLEGADSRLNAYDESSLGQATASAEVGATAGAAAGAPSLEEFKGTSASRLIRGGATLDGAFAEGRINEKTVLDETEDLVQMKQLSDRARRGIEPEYQELYKHEFQDADQQRNFRFMSPQERKEFAQVYDSVKTDPKAAHAMRLLLKADAFSQAPDRNGTPLLETLSRFEQTPLDPKLEERGVRKEALLGQLIHEIAYPTVFQGKNTDHCAPSTVQTIMAASMPGEYARFTADLLTKGQAEVFDGKSVNLALGDLGGQDGRGALDSLVQGSFELFAEGFAEEGEEFGGRGSGGGTFRGQAGEGLTSNQVANLYHFVIGNEPVVAKATDENANKIFEKTLQALDAGLYVPGGLDIDGEDNGYGHAITVMSHDPAARTITYSDSLDQKIKTMPEEEFKRRLTTDGMVILPEPFGAGLEKQKASLFEKLGDLFKHPFSLFGGSNDPDDWGGRGSGGGTAR